MLMSFYIGLFTDLVPRNDIEDKIFVIFGLVLSYIDIHVMFGFSAAGITMSILDIRNNKKSSIKLIIINGLILLITIVLMIVDIIIN